MAKNQRTYDHEYRVQAVKLAQEMGTAAAARELGILLVVIFIRKQTV